ncbi:putative pyruvate formate lyase activating enzyme [Selenomonas ruminantium]|uniref:Putative pyruvate formate lyase activating enzyme n=1 Tax=Selenomonas ruminantium TaxID=971 RepID=A0A1M6R7Q5_SELRU|nr:radical SAM protein [Selenomonas ruminantium]SHK28357.1 putative pyruvate formate lyase activating enzyme [Selenomonas ruminantium]
MLSITKCNLCPRRCGVNRTQRAGFCGAGDKVRIALVSLHQWEEPCLVGEKGAGTVFFSYCNLRCVYCQNHEISHGGKGEEVTVARLAEIFLEQQVRGAATLDLVTPTHYVPQIIAALDMAKEKGFALPVVYNSSGYETVETIEALRGYVDIFLPDLKYREEASGSAYSAAADYFACASAAIRKMVEIAGPVQFAADGQLQKGVLVRHMILPGHRHESMAIVKWLWETFGKTIQVSLMSQYTPMYKASEHKKINRRLTTFEYESVVDYALSLGLENAYVQERRSASEEFVPDFNGAGVQGGE